MCFETLKKIGLSNIDDGENLEQKEFYCIKKHGLLTWLEETKSNKPNFLNLYNPLTIKAKLFSLFIQLIWSLKLQTLFFDKITLNIIKNSYAETIFLQNIDVFSLFTGTVGDNRKVVVYSEFDNKKAFFKLPTNESSFQNISNEIESLKYIYSLDLKSIRYPNLVFDNQSFLAIDDCEISTEYENIDQLAIDFFTELESKTLKNIRVNDYIESIDFSDQDINQLKNLKLKAQILEFNLKSNNCVKNIDKTKNIDICFGHGDFTPWNCFLDKNNNLVVIDWELSSYYTKYFDLIHFIVFSNVLVKKSTIKEIKTLLNALNNSYFKLDKEVWELYLALYLLKVGTYYINKFIIQDESIHEQAYWLIDSWTELLHE